MEGGDVSPRSVDQIPSLHFLNVFNHLRPATSLTRHTWSKTQRDLLRHDLDDVILSRSRPLGAQGFALQHRGGAPGVLDEAGITASLLQILTQITP